ncbi:glutathione S-transferase N-terminal domain-containing protein [Candidatus Woesearchaeota archaeon]|nr:glutathione S-transferase N-terminal domain-containing protein [Candidatus Woesearchaeota archaeon]
MAVTIYTTPTCPWCKKTKEFLKQKKIAFKELDVSSKEKAREEMFKKSKQMGVPVLDINGKIIVGFDPDAIEKALKKK